MVQPFLLYFTQMPYFCGTESKGMKKIFQLLFPLLLVGCNHISNKTTLNGDIKGLGNDTLFLSVSADSAYLDTLYAKGGKFTHSVRVDSLTAASLLFNNGKSHPLFLDKGNEINILGNKARIDQLEVNGSDENEQMTLLLNSLKGMKELQAEKTVEKMIRENPSSFLNIYLLRHYFVEKETVDYAKVKQLISLMNGKLRDDAFIFALNELADSKEQVAIGRYAMGFNTPDAKGVSQSMGNYNNQVLLIHFWASWNGTNNRHKELRKIQQRYKKEKDFAMVGFSLDTDKEEWKQAIKKDSLTWTQLNDLNGWESQAVKNYVVGQVPEVFLIAPDRKIVAHNLYGKALQNQIDKLLKELKDSKKPLTKKP